VNPTIRRRAVAGTAKTSKRKPNTTTVEPTAPTISAHQARRVQYAMTQQLYYKDRHRCAESVLNETWRSGPPKLLSLAEQELFWQPLFSTPSLKDDRPVLPLRQPDWSLVMPIDTMEIEWAIRESTENSPGPDKITLDQVKSIQSEHLGAMFSTWLIASHVPEMLNEGETVLIPKTAATTDPSSYRPITMSSRLVRLFHKILARRLTISLPLSQRQKAFRPVDGCAENVSLLDGILADCKKNLKPLVISFLDVAKAFDSVSHDTILRCMRRLGCPEPLVRYVESIYSATYTRLRVGGKTGQRIHCLRGVRQGDPLSAVLFNCVIDEVLGSLDAGTGYTLTGNILVNCMAFADDLITVSSTTHGQQRLLDTVSNELRQGGLALNPSKCSSLNIVVDGKAKRWTVDSRSVLRLDDAPMTTMSIVDTYKYMGLQTGAQGTRKEYNDSLVAMLRSLTEAPLKPQQRMALARCNLLPRLYHGLVLAAQTAKGLETLDRIVRASVRKWLRLPKDTPLAFFHAKARDGGLGIPRLRHTIPYLRLKRLRKLMMSTDEAVRYIAGQLPFSMQLRRTEKLARHKGYPILTKSSVDRSLQEMLHTSVDGRGLKWNSLVPSVNNWVTDGTGLLTGSDYIQAIKVRGNLLETRMRGARGRHDGDIRCDAGCNARETLSHISQSCARTHPMRTKRHDSLLDYIEKCIKRNGLEYVREPAIPTADGIRRPDLIVAKNNCVTIIDLTITSDHVPMSVACNLKIDYYNKEDVLAWTRAKFPCYPEVAVNAVVLNWRGAVHTDSHELLKALGIHLNDQRILVVRCLTYTANMFKFFRRSTTHHRPIRAREGVG